MALKIIIKPLAEQDIDDAIKWYEEQEENVGEKFLIAFKETLLIVSQNPHSFRKRYKDIRSFSLRKFPFSIFYIFENDTVFVVAVVHQKRNPTIWKKRL